MAKSKVEKLPRLWIKYREEIVPQLIKQFDYKNVMQVPKIEKIALNMGVGDAVQDSKFLDGAVSDLTTVAG